MRRRWQLIPPWGAVGSGVTAIIALGLGGAVPRVLQFAWPAIMIIWSLIVLRESGVQERLRRQIDYQQRAIDAQIETIGQLQQMLYIAGLSGD